jgi:hypothetical protein
VRVVRRHLRSEDWARSRYLWVRIGCDHIFNGAHRVVTFSEDRVVFKLRGRARLPKEIWIEARLRTDIRWIASDYSPRYHARLEASREFTVRRQAVTPYLNAEWFYDTRYDGWGRRLYQLGVEVAVTRHFRYEVYLARREDLLPSESATNALGLFPSGISDI